MPAAIDGQGSAGHMGVVQQITQALVNHLGAGFYAQRRLGQRFGAVRRIVDMFARRLQIQENLTREIADAIESVTQAAGVAVVIEAQHMCMMMRGVEKQNSTMNTSVMLGAFREPSTRTEFLQLIGRSKP